MKKHLNNLKYKFYEMKEDYYEAKADRIARKYNTISDTKYADKELDCWHKAAGNRTKKMKYIE